MRATSGDIISDDFYQRAQVVVTVMDMLCRANRTYKSLSDVSSYLSSKKRSTLAGRKLAREFDAIQMDHMKLVQKSQVLSDTMANMALDKAIDGLDIDRSKVPEYEPTRQSGPLSGMAERIREAGRSHKEKRLDRKLDRMEAEEAAREAGGADAEGACRRPVGHGRFRLAVPFLHAKDVPGKIRRRLDEAMERNRGRRKSHEEAVSEYADGMELEPEGTKPEKGFRRLLSSWKAAKDGKAAEKARRESVDGYDLDEPGAQEEPHAGREDGRGAAEDPDRYDEDWGGGPGAYGGASEADAYDEDLSIYDDGTSAADFDDGNEDSDMYDDGTSATDFDDGDDGPTGHGADVPGAGGQEPGRAWQSNHPEEDAQTAGVWDGLDGGKDPAGHQDDEAEAGEGHGDAVAAQAPASRVQETVSGVERNVQAAAAGMPLDPDASPSDRVKAEAARLAAEDEAERLMASGLGLGE